jgi:hypothetical protein
MVEMQNGARPIFWVSRDPPTVVCPGAGDGERSHGLKMKYGATLFHDGGVLTVESTCAGIISGPRSPTTFTHSARPFR